MPRAPRTRLALLIAAVLVSSAGAAIGTAGAAPTLTDLEAARKRALELQDTLEGIEAERVAIQTRIDVTNEALVKQQDVVRQAQTDLGEARGTLATKMVAMYKSGASDPLVILLAARDFSDLLSRATFVSRIAQAQTQVFRDAALNAAEADHQEIVYEDLKAQDVALRQLSEQRLREAQAAYDEQQRLVARLDAEAKAALAARIAQGIQSRQQWRASSIPLASDIPMTNATVDTQPGVVFQVPAYRAVTSYKSTGTKYVAQCSWYGNQFNGRPTASGQIYNQNDFTCASPTLPFGTTLALTRGDHHIIVIVNDRGPFKWNGTGWDPHPVRDLDLSRASAFALGYNGVQDVQVEEVVAAP